MTIKVVIFDLDGTLVLNGHREHFLKEEPPNWDRFFAAAVHDKPNIPVIAAMSAMADFIADKNMIVCTGRPDVYRYTTERQLAELKVPYDFMLMRKGGDRRPDTVVKKEMLDYLRALPGVEVVLAFDDRPSVIAMWRANDVPVIHIHNPHWDTVPDESKIEVQPYDDTYSR